MRIEVLVNLNWLKMLLIYDILHCSSFRLVQAHYMVGDGYRLNLMLLLLSSIVQLHSDRHRRLLLLQRLLLISWRHANSTFVPFFEERLVKECSGCWGIVVDDRDWRMVSLLISLRALIIFYSLERLRLVHSRAFNHRSIADYWGTSSFGVDLLRDDELGLVFLVVYDLFLPRSSLRRLGRLLNILGVSIEGRIEVGSILGASYLLLLGHLMVRLLLCVWL